MEWVLLCHKMSDDFELTHYDYFKIHGYDYFKIRIVINVIYPHLKTVALH